MSVVNEEPDGTSDGERPKDGSIKTLKNRHQDT